MPAFDEKNPLTPQFRAVAAKHGLTQDAASDLLAIYAAGQIEDTQTQKKAFDGEVAKLGATGPNRIDAVKTWLTAIGATNLANTLWTADIVQGYEKLMQRMSSQGGGDFSQQHREHGPAEPDDATWNSWTFGQKKDWQESRRPNGKTT